MTQTTPSAWTDTADNDPDRGPAPPRLAAASAVSRRARFLGIGLAALLAAVSSADAQGAPVPQRKPVAAAATAPAATSNYGRLPLPATRLVIRPFETSPFPYRGDIPGKDKPFMDVADGDRLGHTAPAGTIRWEHETYSDRRVLIALPKGFDPRRPSVMVVYFHGNRSLLERDVIDRQRIIDQVERSGLNAILVVPQFAHDAPDSSAGNFWRPGFFAAFLKEAERAAIDLCSPKCTAGLAGRPVVVAAYSGGYHPAAYVLHHGGAEERIRGVLLFDALYGDLDKFEGFVARRGPATFFVSTHARSSAEGNRELAASLVRRGLKPAASLPASFKPGTLAFLAGPDGIVHNDFMTRAWTDEPLRALLARIPGYRR
ncbi:alpha/beta hydrolase [Prosthecodimorpha staleyi]|uniref:Alpha/beta hydrolase n=1 Tax=Prosthecodimorpha staleyi TaxID=2840188 RepID=A0A947GDP5_9HYPH|nr:alpha/beta hydrolase [Prosthecodimorpha staleyi]MBT9288485.1 alpha/beta hydrolase [Prosthecodimorpha staleyi]